MRKLHRARPATRVPARFLLAALAALSACRAGDPSARAQTSSPPSTSQPVFGDLPRTRAEDPADRTLAPYFFVGGDAAADLLPLRDTRADVHIAGPIADVRLTQVYKNEGARTIEAVYVFPLSTRAAVHAMTMRVGPRTIEARIRERAQAKEEYLAARRSGRTASLLEQERPNAFQMSVANIQPGDEIRVELRYVELIAPVDHVYELVVPTVVGPRYGNKKAREAGDHDRFVESPYHHAGVPSSHTFAVEALVESPVPLRRVGCPSHGVQVEFPNPRAVHVSLAPGDDVGNRDFILRWTVEGESIESGLLVGESDGQRYFTLMMQPPARVEPQAVLPREYLFVVDVSGSMHGFPLDTAKALMRELLSGLRREDRFDILTFSGSSALFAEAPIEATPGNLRAGYQFVDAEGGGGGTELHAALQRALALPRRGDGGARTVVVITDGYVAIEKEAFELVRRSLGEANLFSVGIGSSVNRFLIEGLARAGRGEPFVVTSPEQAAQTALRFASYLRAPVLANARVSFEGLDVEDVEPQALPDLFAERPIVMHGKIKGGARAGRVVLRGRTASGAFEQALDLAAATPISDGAPLRYLWARERLVRLQDMAGAGEAVEVKPAIVALGLAHHLMTEHTSFVAVDSAVRGDGQNTRADVPQPMPAGVGDSALGHDSAQVLGGLVGTEIGDSYGVGGLGLIGGGYGGGGTGEGTIGLGTLGTIGGGAGRGASASYGIGYGRGAGGLGGRRAVAAPVITPGAVEVRGSLDPEIVRRVIRRHLNEVRFVYEKELLKNPKLKGRIVVRFTISPGGQVVASAVASSTMGSPAVEEGVAAAVRRWEFPKTKGGGVIVVSYPFVFQPSQ